MRRIGYVELGFSWLEEAMHLPPGHRIVEVWLDFDDRWGKRFKVVIEGPTLPECVEGEPMSRVTLLLQHDPKGRLVSQII